MLGTDSVIKNLSTEPFLFGGKKDDLALGHEEYKLKEKRIFNESCSTGGNLIEI